MLGLRRVDARTNKPVQLWRLLLLTGVKITSGAVIRRLMRFPPAPEMNAARLRLEGRWMRSRLSTPGIARL